jgi:hypothetical protein
MVAAAALVAWLSFAQIGVRAVAAEVEGFNADARKAIAGRDPPLSYFVFRGVMAEARLRARRGEAPLDKSAAAILQSALGKWNNYENRGADVKLAVSETHKAAARLRRMVPKGAAVVALGSSPDKIGFVLEASGGVDVAYVSMSRSWIAAKGGEAKKRREFDGLFAAPLALLGSGRRIVLVDYADKFSTLHAVDGMMRKWHPELYCGMSVVVMHDKKTDETHLQAAKTIGAWKTLEIHSLVWHLSKTFRCTPTADESGSRVAASQEDADACDAVRCLLSPGYDLASGRGSLAPG